MPLLRLGLDVRWPGRVVAIKLGEEQRHIELVIQSELGIRLRPIRARFSRWVWTKMLRTRGGREKVLGALVTYTLSGRRSPVSIAFEDDNCSWPTV